MFNWFRKQTPKQKKSSRAVRGISYNSASSRLISPFGTSSSNIDDIIESQFLTITGRARNSYCNNDYVKGFLNQARINIIGDNGIRIQSKTQNEDLNKTIEKSFKKWCKKGNCEVTGMMSFLDVQLMVITSLLRDGEFFIAKRIVDNNLELQLLEVTRIDATYKTQLANQVSVINGVEVDKYGKHLAYYFTDDTNTRKRIDKENIIHGFILEFIGQKRGISAVATALIRLGLLGDFETAAIDNARQAAKIMAFASKSPTDSSLNVNLDFGEEEAEEKVTTVDFGEGASVPIVEDGLDLKKIDSQFPSSEFGNFKDAILRAISLSLGYGVNFINMGNNLEKVNYSSARQGLLSERDAWKLLQKFMIESCLEPIFEWWLEVEYLSGRLGHLTETQYQEILENIRFQPRRWSWIDPLKDAKGVSESLNNRTISLSEAILESGRDPDDVLEQIAADNQKMEDLGIKNIKGVDNDKYIDDTK